MKLKFILENVTKAEVLELQQWLIDTNDFFTYKVESHLTINVCYDDKPIARVDIDTLEPFRVSFKVLGSGISSAALQAGIDGFTMWTRRDAFEDFVEHVLDGLQAYYEA